MIRLAKGINLVIWLIQKVNNNNRFILSNNKEINLYPKSNLKNNLIWKKN